MPEERATVFGARVLCPDPVFVVGAPRSGTTALGKAIGRHRDFYAGDEVLFLDDLAGGMRLGALHERWASRPSSSWLRREQVSLDALLASVGLGINVLLTAGSDGRRWVDHSPSNALMLPTLARMFPDARFLHIVRDGREVVHSMLHMSHTVTAEVAERMGQQAFLPEWTRDFRAACETWRTHVASASAFASARPDRCLTVRQRALETDSAGTMASVFQFLDAPYDGRSVHVLRRRRINSSFAPPGGCRPDEYHRPEPTATWTSEQWRIFLDVASDTMAELGFATVEELRLAPACAALAADSSAVAPALCGDACLTTPARASVPCPINARFPGLRREWNEADERAWHADIVDPAFWALAAKYCDVTLSNTAALYALYSSTHHVLAAGIPGDLVECGTFFGGGAMLMAELCVAHGESTRRHVYALDTFSGSLRRGEEDVDADGSPVGVPLEPAVDWQADAAVNLRAGDWPDDVMRIVPGDVVDTASGLDCTAIALLRLDTDTFDTTLAALTALYPRVSIGGAVIVGNYGWARGQRLACQRYFAERPVLMTRIDRYSVMFMKTRCDTR